MEMTPEECWALYKRAFAAGLEAAKACVPTAMAVNQNSNPFDSHSEVLSRDAVADDNSGFACVFIYPDNSPFAVWLKNQGLARPGYEGSVYIYLYGYNQNLQRNEAHALAMAHVFRNAGIEAYIDTGT